MVRLQMSSTQAGFTKQSREKAEQKYRREEILVNRPESSVSAGLSYDLSSAGLNYSPRRVAIGIN
jgi:hypothetical protein